MKPRQIPRVPSKRWAQGPMVNHAHFWKVTAQEFESELVEFWDFARECLPGLASPSLEPSRGTLNDAGNSQSPTETAALQPTDVHVRAWRELCQSVGEITGAMARLRGAWSVLRPLDPEIARGLAEERKPERGSQCDNPNCARWVAGGTKDPIRAGRCTACAAFWKRNGKDRPRELVEDQVYREAG